MASSHIPRALLRSSNLSSIARSSFRGRISCPASTRSLSSLPKILPRAHSSLFSTPQSQIKRINQLNTYRAFSSAAKRLAEDNRYQPGAYVGSGVLEASRGKLVDVKKVLVIGSGGLSIGQAGEFDYSGMSMCWIAMELGLPTDMTNLRDRLASDQGFEGSGREVDTTQSQHCNDPDKSLPCRRSVLPTGDPGIYHPCY